MRSISNMDNNPISPLDEACVRARARSGVTNASLRLGTSICTPHPPGLEIRNHRSTSLRYWPGFRKGHTGLGGGPQGLLSLATTHRVNLCRFAEEGKAYRLQLAESWQPQRLRTWQRCQSSHC